MGKQSNQSPSSRRRPRAATRSAQKNRRRCPRIPSPHRWTPNLATGDGTGVPTNRFWPREVVAAPIALVMPEPSSLIERHPNPVSSRTDSEGACELRRSGENLTKCPRPCCDKAFFSSSRIRQKSRLWRAKTFRLLIVLLIPHNQPWMALL